VNACYFRVIFTDRDAEFAVVTAFQLEGRKVCRSICEYVLICFDLIMWRVISLSKDEHCSRW